MIKRVIFFIEAPYSKRDHKRWGIDILKNNGFEIEIWDCTPVYHPDLNLTIADPFEFPGLKKFQKRKNIISSILKLSKDDLVITWFQYQLRFFWFYRALSKSKVSYAVLFVTTIPNVIGQGVEKNKVRLKINNFLKRVWSLLVSKNIVDFNWHIRYFANRIFIAIPYKIFGIKCPVLWFAGGKDSLKYFVVPSCKTTQIVWLHAQDYDRYLDLKNSLTRREETTASPKAVFLDMYLPFHEDFAMSKQLPYVTADNYYASIRRFLDFVEKELGIEVEIAAHPRSHYTENCDYYGARNIRKGHTDEMVRDAKFVITHDSAALNLAVIYKKPVIFTFTDEMAKSEVIFLIYEMSSWLNKQPINIDQPLSINWDEALKVEDIYYENYKKAFIKKPNTPELHSWQIAADVIKNFRSTAKP